MLSLSSALVAVCAMAAILVACRSLPFLLFSKGEAPSYLGFVERYMPPIAMTVLAVSAYAGIKWTSGDHGLPEAVAGAAVAVMHLWKRNALLSIFGGTAFYLVLKAFIE